MFPSDSMNMSGQNEMYCMCFNTWTTDLHRVKQHTGRPTKAFFIHIRRTSPWQEIIFDPSTFQFFHKKDFALTYSHLKTPHWRSLVFVFMLDEWWNWDDVTSMYRRSLTHFVQFKWMTETVWGCGPMRWCLTAIHLLNCSFEKDL